MKKIFLFTIGIFTLLNFLISCTKDNASTDVNEEFDISIPVTAPDTAYPNRQISFVIEVQAISGLEKVEVRRDFQLLEGTVQNFNGSTTAENYNFTFVANRFDIGKTFDFVIAAYNKNGYTFTRTYSVAVTEAPVNISINIPESAPDTLVMLSETVQFPISFISEFPIVSLTTSLNGVVLDSLTKTSFSNPLGEEYDFHYTPGELDAGQLLNFEFSATDEEGKIKTVEYPLFIKGERPPQPVVSYTAQLGGQANTEHGHFLNSTTGSIHFRTGVAAISETIDIVHWVSGSSSGVNLTAPSFGNNSIIYSVANSGNDAIANWPFRNATQLIRLAGLTQTDFDNVSMDTAIVTLFENGGETTDNVNRIQPNDIIVFKTVKGKHGLIWVEEKPANNRGVILLHVKIQP